MAARLDLTILNSGAVSTFRRGGCQGTIIDITLASTGIAATTRGWQVMEDFTGSDHQYIKLWAVTSSGGKARNGFTRIRGCNNAKLNRSVMLRTLARAYRGGAPTRRSAS